MDEQTILDHIQDEADARKEQHKFNVEAVRVHNELSSKMDGLATKKDIELLNSEMKGYIIGGNVFKFTFENGGKITAFLGLFVILGMVIKYGIPGLIAFFLHSLSSLKSNL